MTAKRLQQWICGDVRLGSRAEVGALRTEIAQLVASGVPRKIIWKELTASGQVRSSYQAFTRRLRLMRIGAATAPAAALDSWRQIESGVRPESEGRLIAGRTFRPNPTPDLDALI